MKARSISSAMEAIICSPWPTNSSAPWMAAHRGSESAVNSRPKPFLWIARAQVSRSLASVGARLNGDSRLEQNGECVEKLGNFDFRCVLILAMPELRLG